MASLTMDTKDTYCESCSYEYKTTVAVYFCVQCFEFLCKHCALVHRKMKVTRSHNVLSVDDGMSYQKLSTDLAVQTCEKHARQIEFYCEKHACVECNVCVTLYHKTCDVSYIPSLAKDYDNSSEYQGLIKDIEGSIEKSKDVCTHAKENLSCVSEVFEQFVSGIKQLRSKLNDTVDSLEEDIVKQAKVKRDEQLDKMSSVSSELETVEDKVKNISERAGRLQQSPHGVANATVGISSFIGGNSTKNDAEEMRDTTKDRYSAFIAITNELTLCEKTVADISARNEVDMFEFKPNIALMDTLNTSGLAHLADSTGNNTVKGLKLVRETDLGTFASPDTCIHRIANISSNRIVATDLFNDRVYIIDLSLPAMISTRQFKRTTFPYDVTCVNADIIVVAYEGKVVFLTNPELEITKELHYFCEHIIHCNDTLILTSAQTRDIAAFDVHDLRPLWNVKLDMLPDDLDADKDGRHFFVADYRKKELLQTNHKGVILQKICLPTPPGGIAVDGHSNVLITSYEGIFVCDPSGSTRKMLPVEEEDEPSAITCQRSDNTLIVALSDRIFEYTIEYGDE